MNRIKWFSAIRAFGLSLILGYHLFYDSFPAGFLGVDIFFTLSGYLITAIIIDELRKKNGFDLLGFFKRRVHRIVLPLVVSIIFTLPFLLLISPDFSVGIDKQVAAALAFATNWVQILTGGSYEAKLLPDVYIHTWSLAIEMQFYIAWGLVCALLAVIAKAVYKGSGEKRSDCFRLLVLAVSGTLAVGLYFNIQRMYDAGGSLDAIYFNTFTRLLPFFVGSFAASVWGGGEDKWASPGKLHPYLVRTLTTAFIAVTLSASAYIFRDAIRYGFSDENVYRHGFLLTSLMTVVMIYGTRALSAMTPKRIEEPRLLSGVSELSYNVYLYHWPLWIVFSELVASRTLAALTTLACAFAFSAFSFYVIERLFAPKEKKETTVTPKRRRHIETLTTAAAMVSFAVGVIVLFRAPAITSIETDFAVNHVVSDSYGIVSLKDKVDAINEMPVVYAGENAPLQANLLPGVYSASDLQPASVSDPQQDDATDPPQDSQTDTPQTSPSGQQVATPPSSAPKQQPPASPDTQPSAPPKQKPTTPTDTDPTTPPDAQPTTPPDAEPSTPPGEGQEPGEPPDTEPSEPPDTGQGSIPAGVTVIGDSVSLGAQTTLQNTIPKCYVDSLVSRPVKAGLGILTDLQKKGELREYVVLALGTNGTNNYEKLFTEMIEALPPGHRLIIVTPFDGRANENSKVLEKTAAWMRGLPAKYSFITVADWNALISTQTEYLAKDKVHMGGATAKTLYANCVADAIAIAAGKPAK